MSTRGYFVHCVLLRSCEKVKHPLFYISYMGPAFGRDRKPPWFGAFVWSGERYGTRSGRNSSPRPSPSFLRRDGPFDLPLKGGGMRARGAIQQASRSFRRQGLRFYFTNTLNILIKCRLQPLISSWAPRQCCRSATRNTVQLPAKGDGTMALNTNPPVSPSPVSVPPLRRPLLWLSRLLASGHKPRTACR